MTHLYRLATVAALLCAAGWARGDTGTGQVIGGFAEISNHVSGAMPGQKPAPKQLKSPAHFGELVRTEAGARANISFIDGSHVLLGERAELTIDSFVFDPKTGTEEAAYNLTAGALRLVSGAIKGDKLKIQTPTAAITVRGTNLKIRVLESGETLVVVNRGAVEIVSRRTGASASLGPGQNVSANLGGLSDVESGNAEVDDGFVDDTSFDGDPDLADVDLSDLGFSADEANEIESAVDAESEGDAESGDSDSGDSDSSDGDSGDSDSGDSGSDGGDSGGDGGGGSDGGGGGDGGGGDGGD